MSNLKILLAVIAAATIGWLAAVSETTSQSPDFRKARYYYMAGAQAMAEDRETEAYEYFKKASSICPSYPEAAYEFAAMRITNNCDTLATLDEKIRSMEMMTPFVNLHPEDHYKCQYYAYVATQLDTLDETLRVYKAMEAKSPDYSDILVFLADTYARMGRFKEGIDALDRYQRIEGRSPQLTLQKVAYHIGDGDTVGALAETDDLLASNPTDPGYLVLKGNVLDYIGMSDSAYVYYLRAEQAAPDNGQAKIALANYFQSKGDSVAYDHKVYQALLSEDFGVEEKTALLADYLSKLFSDQSDTSRGDTLFSVLAEQYPHDPKMIEFAARYAASKEDLALAEERIRYAIDMDSDEPTYWEALMTYQIGADKPQEAMKTYKEALGHVADSESLSLMYASAAQIADSIPVVLDVCGRLIRTMVPTFPVEEKITDKSAARNLNFYDIVKLSSYYEILGDAFYAHYQATGKNDSTYLNKTYTAYDNSLELLPDNYNTLNNYAFFLCENGGDLQKAKEMSARSLTYGESSTNLDTYAWILFRLGEYKDAKTYQATALEKAAEEGTESAELFHHYGDILFMNGEPDKAVEFWGKALELEPDNDLLKKKVEHKTFFYN